LSEFGNDITLNADLFAKVKAIYEQKKLESQSRKTTLLDKKYKSFSETVPICENKKNSSRNRQRTIEDSLKFGENVLPKLKGSNCILSMKDLSGLPEGTIEAARSLAKSQESNGWILL
jgi:peptidyl-dipeptidase Dcp